MGKKSKIKKLTDEQYLAYITGLKEGFTERSELSIPPAVRQEKPDESKDN